MKLTDYQLKRIFNMAVEAYAQFQLCKNAEDDNKRNVAYARNDKYCYAIYQSLSCIAGRELSISEGRDIVLSNGVDREPSLESVRAVIESL